MQRFWQWLKDRRPRVTRVDFVPGTLFELKKNRHYVLAISRQAMGLDDIMALAKILHNKGIENIICVALDRDPQSSVTVVEDEQ